MEVLFINRERRIHQRQADSDNGLELELVLGRWPVAGGQRPLYNAHYPQGVCYFKKVEIRSYYRCSTKMLNNTEVADNV